MNVPKVPAWLTRIGQAWRWLSLVGLAILGWLWFTGRDIGAHAVAVKVTFSGGRPEERLEELRLVVGASRSSWPSVRSGETVAAVLDPHGESPQVSLTFMLGGNRRVWEGPPMNPGTGYRIAVRIDGQGSVSQRSCLSPCRLP